MVPITFVINGVDVTIQASESEPLAVARDAALEATSNLGRDDWHIRDGHGVTLPAEEEVEKFNFLRGVQLFLMPNVGAGG